MGSAALGSSLGSEPRSASALQGPQGAPLNRKTADKRRTQGRSEYRLAGVAEQADAPGLGPGARKGVRVRPPAPAPASACPAAGEECALTRKHTLVECRCDCGVPLRSHREIKPSPIVSWRDEQSSNRALGRPPTPAQRPHGLEPLTIHRPHDDGTGHCRLCHRSLTFRRGQLEHHGNRWSERVPA